DTLHSMHELAVGYSALGRHADALNLRGETLARRQARLGPDHRDTLASLEDLANSYHALGRHAQALPLYQKALARRRAKPGPVRPDTLHSMHGLAAGYGALGRHADALKLHAETLGLRKAKLGPNHRDTLRSMSGVAESLAKLERGAEAVPIIDECVRRAAGKACCQRDLLPDVMGIRLRQFEKTRDATGCRQTAEMWEGLNLTNADSAYNAARMRAVTSAVFRAADEPPAGGKQADAEADRAMAWLRQAVA